MLSSGRCFTAVAIFCSFCSVACAGGNDPPPPRGGGATGGGGGTGLGGGTGIATGSGGTPIIPDIIVKSCGDGVIDPTSGEQCDDANKTSGDGCTQVCQLEADWQCPTAGQPCVFNSVCGDGRLSSIEAC